MEKKNKPKEKFLYPIEIVNNIYNFANENTDSSAPELVKCIKENAGKSIKDISINLILPLVYEFKKVKREQEEDVAMTVASGVFLQDEPFIPEYLGFEESIIENEQGMVRMYQKDDFVLMRNYFETIEKGRDKWVVTKNVGNNDVENASYVFSFKNMLHAVVCLESIGMNVSLVDVALAQGI